MDIKGEYRDIIKINGEINEDKGWRCNHIVEDYGKFLAALMKKDFNKQVGIDYLVVGSGSNKDVEIFKNRARHFFETGDLQVLHTADYWIWAKKINTDDIKYMDETDQEAPAGSITNKLEINIIIEKTEPSTETLEFKEFALIGIDKKPDSSFDTDRMFFIDYVDHGPITKDDSMELSRTIKLTFPIKKEVVI